MGNAFHMGISRNMLWSSLSNYNDDISCCESVAYNICIYVYDIIRWGFEAIFINYE